MHISLGQCNPSLQDCFLLPDLQRQIILKSPTFHTISGDLSASENARLKNEIHQLEAELETVRERNETLNRLVDDLRGQLKSDKTQAIYDLKLMIYWN